MRQSVINPNFEADDIVFGRVDHNDYPIVFRKDTITAKEYWYDFEYTPGKDLVFEAQSAYCPHIAGKNQYADPTDKSYKSEMHDTKTWQAMKSEFSTNVHDITIDIIDIDTNTTIESFYFTPNAPDPNDPSKILRFFDGLVRNRQGDGLLSNETEYKLNIRVDKSKLSSVSNLRIKFTTDYVLGPFFKPSTVPEANKSYLRVRSDCGMEFPENCKFKFLGGKLPWIVCFYNNIQDKSHSRTSLRKLINPKMADVAPTPMEHSKSPDFYTNKNNFIRFNTVGDTAPNFIGISDRDLKPLKYLNEFMNKNYRLFRFNFGNYIEEDFYDENKLKNISSRDYILNFYGGSMIDDEIFSECDLSLVSFTLDQSNSRFQNYLSFNGLFNGMLYANVDKLFSSLVEKYLDSISNTNEIVIASNALFSSNIVDLHMYTDLLLKYQNLYFEGIGIFSFSHILKNIPFRFKNIKRNNRTNLSLLFCGSNFINGDDQTYPALFDYDWTINNNINIFNNNPVSDITGMFAFNKINKPIFEFKSLEEMNEKIEFKTISNYGLQSPFSFAYNKFNSFYKGNEELPDNDPDQIFYSNFTRVTLNNCMNIDYLFFNYDLIRRYYGYTDLYIGRFYSTDDKSIEIKNKEIMFCDTYTTKALRSTTDFTIDDFRGIDALVHIPKLFESSNIKNAMYLFTGTGFNYTITSIAGIIPRVCFADYYTLGLTAFTPERFMIADDKIEYFSFNCLLLGALGMLRFNSDWNGLLDAFGTTPLDNTHLNAGLMIAFLGYGFTTNYEQYRNGIKKSYIQEYKNSILWKTFMKTPELYTVASLRNFITSSKLKKPGEYIKSGFGNYMVEIFLIWTFKVLNGLDEEYPATAGDRTYIGTPSPNLNTTSKFRLVPVNYHGIDRFPQDSLPYQVFDFKHRSNLQVEYLYHMYNSFHMFKPTVPVEAIIHQNSREFYDRLKDKSLENLTSTDLLKVSEYSHAKFQNLASIIPLNSNKFHNFDNRHFKYYKNTTNVNSNVMCNFLLSFNPNRGSMKNFEIPVSENFFTDINTSPFHKDIVAFSDSFFTSSRKYRSCYAPSGDKGYYNFNFNNYFNASLFNSRLAFVDLFDSNGAYMENISDAMFGLSSGQGVMQTSLMLNDVFINGDIVNTSIALNEDGSFNIDTELSYLVYPAALDYSKEYMSENNHIIFDRNLSKDDFSNYINKAIVVNKHFKRPEHTFEDIGFDDISSLPLMNSPEYENNFCCKFFIKDNPTMPPSFYENERGSRYTYFGDDFREQYPDWSNIVGFKTNLREFSLVRENQNTTYLRNDCFGRRRHYYNINSYKNIPNIILNRVFDPGFNEDKYNNYMESKLLLGHYTESEYNTQYINKLQKLSIRELNNDESYYLSFSYHQFEPMNFGKIYPFKGSKIPLSKKEFDDLFLKQNPKNVQYVITLNKNDLKKLGIEDSSGSNYFSDHNRKELENIILKNISFDVMNKNDKLKDCWAFNCPKPNNTEYSNLLRTAFVEYNIITNCLVYDHCTINEEDIGNYNIKRLHTNIDVEDLTNKSKLNNFCNLNNNSIAIVFSVSYLKESFLKYSLLEFKFKNPKDGSIHDITHRVYSILGELGPFGGVIYKTENGEVVEDRPDPMNPFTIEPETYKDYDDSQNPVDNIKNLKFSNIFDAYYRSYIDKSYNPKPMREFYTTFSTIPAIMYSFNSIKNEYIRGKNLLKDFYPNCKIVDDNGWFTYYQTDESFFKTKTVDYFTSRLPFSNSSQERELDNFGTPIVKPMNVYFFKSDDSKINIPSPFLGSSLIKQPNNDGLSNWCIPSIEELNDNMDFRIKNYPIILNASQCLNKAIPVNWFSSLYAYSNIQTLNLNTKLNNLEVKLFKDNNIDNFNVFEKMARENKKGNVVSPFTLDFKEKTLKEMFEYEVEKYFKDDPLRDEWAFLTQCSYDYFSNEFKDRMNGVDKTIDFNKGINSGSNHYSYLTNEFFSDFSHICSGCQFLTITNVNQSVFNYDVLNFSFSFSECYNLLYFDGTFQTPSGSEFIPRLGITDFRSMFYGSFDSRAPYYSSLYYGLYFELNNDRVYNLGIKDAIVRCNHLYAEKNYILADFMFRDTGIDFSWFSNVNVIANAQVIQTNASVNQENKNAINKIATLDIASFFYDSTRIMTYDFVDPNYSKSDPLLKKSIRHAMPTLFTSFCMFENSHVNSLRNNYYNGTLFDIASWYDCVLTYLNSMPDNLLYVNNHNGMFAQRPFNSNITEFNIYPYTKNIFYLPMLVREPKFDFFPYDSSLSHRFYSIGVDVTSAMFGNYMPTISIHDDKTGHIGDNGLSLILESDTDLRNYFVGISEMSNKINITPTIITPYDSDHRDINSEVLIYVSKLNFDTPFKSIKEIYNTNFGSEVFLDNLNLSYFLARNENSPMNTSLYPIHIGSWKRSVQNEKDLSNLEPAINYFKIAISGTNMLENITMYTYSDTFKNKQILDENKIFKSINLWKGDVYNNQTYNGVVFVPSEEKVMNLKGFKKCY